MVSNIDRIVEEIRREASLIAPKYKLESDRLVELIMEIVNTEDQHRIRAVSGVHQKAKNLIQDVALAGTVNGDDD